jgi:hypothetical protein
MVDIINKNPGEASLGVMEKTQTRQSQAYQSIQRNGPCKNDSA